jgi:predicted anti-sigma-YlaC factor YlaD
MKPVDMEKAWNKDGEAFIFAVLHGYSVASDQQRAVIESHLRGPHQIRLYYKRLANSRRRKQEGDAPVRAVTPDGQELLESLSEYAEKPTQEMLRLQKIEQQIPALALQNARTLKSLQWVLVLLIVVLVVVIKRGWSYP